MCPFYIKKVNSTYKKSHLTIFPMTLDYTTKVEVKIDIGKYVENMIDEFPINIKNSRQ